MHQTTFPRAIPVFGAFIAALALALLLVVPASADATLTTALTGAEEAPGPGDGGGSGVALVDITTSSGEISTGATFSLADATFMQTPLCEDDISRDLDSNPDTNVCVDFSFYSIPGVAEGDVTVVETLGPGEHEFGTIRFTPAELDPDDDSRTLLGFDRGTSTVNVDTSLDDDAMVMLHVYNFDTAAVAGASASPTPVAGELPDAAVDVTGTPGTGAVAILFGIVALASIGFLGYRTMAARRTR